MEQYEVQPSLPWCPHHWKISPKQHGLQGLCSFLQQEAHPLHPRNSSSHLGTNPATQISTSILGLGSMQYGSRVGGTKFHALEETIKTHTGIIEALVKILVQADCRGRKINSCFGHIWGIKGMGKVVLRTKLICYTKKLLVLCVFKVIEHTHLHKTPIDKCTTIHIIKK